MDSITLTIKLKDMDACEGDFDQLVSDIQAFINILHHASPDYVEAGNILQQQLDEQIKQHKEEATDPVESMRKRLDEMCPYAMEAMQDADIKNLYAGLKSEIGEAMGPVSYAAYKLAQGLRTRDLSVDWVFKFVDYYEKNWKF
jgi:hypothetical protein